MGAAEYKRMAQEFLKKATSTDVLLERLAELEAKLAAMESKKAPDTAQDPTKGRTRSLREQAAEATQEA
jgi:hypothetical protein